MIIFNERYLGASGIIGEFLSPDDPRPAKEQIHTAYAHGGGWVEFEGFTPHINWDSPDSSYLEYPEDPPTKAKAYALFGEELIIIYDYDWCSITHSARGTSIARLD